MKWQDRNWRAKVAQAETYVGMGEYQVQRVVRYLTAGAVLKILWWSSMPWWAVFALGPPVLASCWAIGYAMNRWGWTKQAQEVSPLENMSRLAVASLHWQVRQARALGYPLNDIPEGVPDEMQEILASTKKVSP